AGNLSLRCQYHGIPEKKFSYTPAPAASAKVSSVIEWITRACRASPNSCTCLAHATWSPAHVGMKTPSALAAATLGRNGRKSRVPSGAHVTPVQSAPTCLATSEYARSNIWGHE